MSEAPLHFPRQGDVRLPPENAVEAALEPQPEQVHESLAAKLRAQRDEIKAKREQFSVPGWDDNLVVEITALHDRKDLKKGLTNEQFILKITTRVLYRDDDGELQDVDGWRGLGTIMGLDLNSVSLGQIVREVLDNPLRLDGFASDLLGWIAGRKSVIDQLLGEA